MVSYKRASSVFPRFKNLFCARQSFAPCGIASLNSNGLCQGICFATLHSDMACPFPFCFGTATQVLHLLQGRCCATLARPFRTAVALRRFSLRSSFSVHAKPLRRSGLVQTAGGACGVCVLSVCCGVGSCVLWCSVNTSLRSNTPQHHSTHYTITEHRKNIKDVFRVCAHTRHTPAHVPRCTPPVHHAPTPGVILFVLDNAILRGHAERSQTFRYATGQALLFAAVDCLSAAFVRQALRSHPYATLRAPLRYDCSVLCRESPSLLATRHPQRSACFQLESDLKIIDNGG